MAAVRRLGFHIFAIFIYVNIQNLVKIGRSVAKLFRIFDFQYGSRPPSWS